MLRDVVNAPNGNRQKAKPSTDVGGKTGTRRFQDARQVMTNNTRHLRDYRVFVAVAPVDCSEIAIAVLIEHAEGRGGAIMVPDRARRRLLLQLTRGRSYQLASAEPRGATRRVSMRL